MAVEKTETPRGLTDLMDTIAATLDPGRKPGDGGKQDGKQAEPKGRSRQETKEKHPGSMGELRNRMHSSTEGIAGQKAAELSHRLFAMSSGALRTLENLELPEGTVREIESLNFMAIPPTFHAVRHRLEVLASLPPTAAEPGAQPDWKRWWLDHRESHIGVARPQDHNPHRDPACETFNTAIAAAAHEAGEHLPSFAEIARDWLARPDRKKGGLRVSHVFAAAVETHGLARRTGVDAGKRYSEGLARPEAITEELEREGINVRRDMGSIGPIREMRETVQAAGGPRSIRACGAHGTWHAKDAEKTHLLTPGWNRVHWQNPEPEPQLRREEDTQERSPAEWALMRLTVPEHPALTNMRIHTPEPKSAATIAFLSLTTPLAALGFLEGRSEDPSPPPGLSPCPAAGGCPTQCGYLQRSGALPFPLTWDGRHESCGYRKFLAVQEGAPPELREEAALAGLEQERLGDRRRKKSTGAGKTRKGASSGETSAPEGPAGMEAPEGEKAQDQPADSPGTGKPGQMSLF